MLAALKLYLLRLQRLRQPRLHHVGHLPYTGTFLFGQPAQTTQELRNFAAAAQICGAPGV